MTIVIPEDRYLQGYHYVGTYTDSNESVTSAGLDTYLSLPQKGFSHGIAMMYRASATAHCYMFKFTATSLKAFGIGGFNSSTGTTFSARPYGGTLSDTNAFTSSGNIWLANLYIDDANERIVMSWDTSSGSPTLDAKADFWVGKGDVVA